MFICFFYIWYNLLWFRIYWNLWARCFLASAILWGLLANFMLVKMDWCMEPLLSMINRMIGGVILNFTLLNQPYDSFLLETCSYYCCIIASSWSSTSCRNGKTNWKFLCHLLLSGFCGPTYSNRYLFYEKGMTESTSCKGSVAFRSKSKLIIVDLDGVESISYFRLCFVIEEIGSRYKH